MKSLFASFARVSSHSFVNALLALAAAIVIARALGPEGSGEVALYVAAASLSSIIIGMGSGIALRLQSRGALTTELARSYSGLSLALGVLAALVVPVVALIGTGAGSSITLLALAALLGFSTFMARQFQELLQSSGALVRSVSGVGKGQLGRLIVMGTALAVGVFSLELALLAASIGLLVQCAVGLVALGPNHNFVRPTIAPGKWRSLIGLGVKSMGYSVGQALIQRVNRVIIVALVGAHAGGLYVAAAAVSESMRILSVAAGQVLFLQVSRDETRSHPSGLTWITVLILGSGAIILWVAAPFLISTLYGRDFLDAVGVLRILVIAEVFMGLALIDSRVLIGAGHVWLVARYTISFSIIAVLAYWLTALYGSLFSTTLTILFVYIGYAILLRILFLASKRRAS